MIIRNWIKLGGGAQGSTAHKQPSFIKLFRRFMRKLKPSAAITYVGVFVFVVAMIFVGYGAPKKQSTAVANAASINQPNPVDQTSVDNVVATGVAAEVAQIANLPIATSVANMAVSAQTKSDYTQSEAGVGTVKPQIIESDKSNRTIVSYTTIAGDTVDTLAVKYNISKDTIKWANNLTSDNLEVGKVLRILPVDGVLYSVKEGDTIDSIATKYGVDKTRLVLYNDLEVSGLAVNTSIILPSGNLPETERPGYEPPKPKVTSSYNNYYARAGSVGNLYAIGNCTWYAYERRAQLGRPVGSYWGNANTWAISASGTGYAVDRNPSAGAVLVDEFGWFGHVAVVESVSANGDIVISEMNNYAYGGWNRVNNRTISAGQASGYKYIH